MYSKEVIKHFQNPRNMGKMKRADATAEVGNKICGDIMTIYLKVKNEKIADISFETMGCVAAIATSSMITELAKGKTLAEAKKITFKDIADALGQLPPIKEHCANLAVEALQAAIKNYERKQFKN